MRRPHPGAVAAEIAGGEAGYYLADLLDQMGAEHAGRDEHEVLRGQADTLQELAKW